MGRLDEGLIDHGYNTVFSKGNVDSEGFDMAIASVKYTKEGEVEVRKQKYTSPQLELLKGRSHTIPLSWYCC